MKKHERTELERTEAALAAGLIDRDCAARAVSALVRAASWTARNQLIDAGIRLGLHHSPDWIV